MGTTHQLTWGRLRVERNYLDENRRTVRHPAPVVKLFAYTRSEQAREIELTERELIELIADASAALVTLHKDRRETAARIAQQQRQIAEGMPR